MVGTGGGGQREHEGQVRERADAWARGDISSSATRAYVVGGETVMFMNRRPPSATVCPDRTRCRPPTMAYGQLTSAIRKRHALGRAWRTDPSLPQGDIASPIVVVGQMRAGTTRMHRLLAADPDHAGTRFCDSHNPVPVTPDWRPLKAAAALAIARRINPWRQAQSLQEVPIAVSAFDAEALESQQIENAADLQLTLPNVSFAKGNFTTSTFTIRGIGDLCVGVTCDSATAIHANGSPLFGTRLFETEFFDL